MAPARVKTLSSVVMNPEKPHMNIFQYKNFKEMVSGTEPELDFNYKNIALNNRSRSGVKLLEQGYCPYR